MPLGALLNKFSTLFRSIKNVSGSISTKTTSPPQYLIQFAEAAKVKLVVIIPAAHHRGGEVFGDRPGRRGHQRPVDPGHGECGLRARESQRAQAHRRIRQLRPGLTTSAEAAATRLETAREADPQADQQERANAAD